MKEQNPYAIAGSIIFAALLITGAIIYKDKAPTPLDQKDPIAIKALDKNNFPAVTKDDHINGDLKAPLKLVVYSDLECPFCKYFHFELQKLAKDYVTTGKLAIIYRQLPIESLHSKAKKEAEASECVAELGGNSKFWQYLDKIYAITPSNDGLELTKLPELASELGLDPKNFNQCLDSGKYSEKISKSITEANSLGIQGTPAPFIIDNKGNITPLGGYVKYEVMKPMIEKSLK